MDDIYSEDSKEKVKITYTLIDEKFLGQLRKGFSYYKRINGHLYRIQIKGSQHLTSSKLELMLSIEEEIMNTLNRGEIPRKVKLDGKKLKS